MGHIPSGTRSDQARREAVTAWDARSQAVRAARRPAGIMRMPSTSAASAASSPATATAPDPPVWAVVWLGRLRVDPLERPEAAPHRIGHLLCRLETVPPRNARGLAAWSAAFLDCCPIAGDEPQVKVERPQRSEDVRPLTCGEDRPR
jgi:hypothetical protein